MVSHLMRADNFSLIIFFLDPTGLGRTLCNLHDIRAYYMLNHRQGSNTT